MTAERHPSFLALDSHAVGARWDPAVAQHVDRCRRCAAHVVRIRAGATPPERSWQARVSTRPVVRRRAWTLPVAAALAALLVLLAVRDSRDATRPRRHDRATAATTAKGAGTALGLFVRRGARVFPWDGRAALRAGDRVRLQISGSPGAAVAVHLDEEPRGTGPGGATARDLLYRGVLEPDGQTLLPVAWEIDRLSSRVTLRVTISATPATATRPPGAAAAIAPPSTDLVMRLSFAVER
jgi:hypothetical protein